MATRWKEIENSNGYWVSNDGQVRRNGRVIRISYTPSGWPRVRFYRNGKARWCLVAQLVIEMFGDEHKLKFLPKTCIPDEDWEALKIHQNGEDCFDELLIKDSPLFELYPEKVAYKKLAEIYGVSLMMIYRLKWGSSDWTAAWAQDH